MIKNIVKWMLALYLFLPFAAVAQQEEGKEPVTENATPLSPKDSLKFFERRLVGLGESIITARSQEERNTSTYFFARTLIAALKQPGSYEYTFDSVRKYVSLLTAPDNAFRIFTWSLKWGKDTLVTADSFEFYGAIQMNNPDRLELYGLYDSSARLGKPEFTELSNRFWYGALYYHLVMTKYKKQKYYTLLGWDGHTMASNRKVIDVLWFDETGKPRFGAPIFKLDKDQPLQHRVIFEFRNDAVMVLRYIKKKKIIAFEHLIPPSPNAVGLFEQYLPDGSYDYFVFKKGIWLKKENLFENMNIPPEEFAPGNNRMD